MWLGCSKVSWFQRADPAHRDCAVGLCFSLSDADHDGHAASGAAHTDAARRRARAGEWDPIKEFESIEGGKGGKGRMLLVKLVREEELVVKLGARVGEHRGGRRAFG